ncbi:HIRAN domain-containing protein, partial [Mycobacterium tuberculosis]
MQELTLAVVGIDFPNTDGSNRRSEAMMTLPGESVELVPEPKNKHDSNAIAVISPRGIQLGYVNAERAP